MPKSKAADAKFEQASLQLEDGLTVCRAMVTNYRALIADERIPTKDDAAANSEAVPAAANSGD